MTEEKKLIKIEYKPAATIHGAFINVCAEADNAKRNKTGQVGNQKYKYATLEDVLDILQPLLAQEKLALAQYVEGDDLVAKLYHESGTSIEMGRYNLGALIDHQKRGSAITYGRRYQLCAIFGITQEDDDAASAGNVKKPEAAQPTAFGSVKEREHFFNKLSRDIDKCNTTLELKTLWENINGTMHMANDGNDEDKAASKLALSKFNGKKKALASLEQDGEFLKQ